MSSWLVRSSPDRAVWVRALAWDIALTLCSWARHFTLTVPLSTQEYMGTGEGGGGGVERLETLLVASFYGNRNELFRMQTYLLLTYRNI